jgi:pyridoxal 5'-phosphate synthase pdxT subunit
MPPAERPVIGVLALQGDVAEHCRALEQAGARPLAVRDPAALEQVAGLIIPGGESTTIWKLADLTGLAVPLRKRVAAGMPAFGSCAGMVMLARRLAGAASGQETLDAIDMTVRRNAFGRQADSFEADLSVAGLRGLYRGVFIRAPWAQDVGPDAEVLAVEPRTGAVVAVRQGPALATAFHPELTGDPRFHELFVAIVREQGVAR